MAPDPESQQEQQQQQQQPKPCTFPLLRANVYTMSSGTGRDTFAAGIALQKGVFFTCGSVLFGRDGVVRLVRATRGADSWGNTFKYGCLARLMALFDAIQFALFGSIALALVAALLVPCSLVGTLVSAPVVAFCHCCCRFRPCAIKTKIFCVTCLVTLLASLGSIAAHLVLYVLLPVGILVPEVLFGDQSCLEIDSWGFQIDKFIADHDAAQAAAMNRLAQSFFNGFM